MLYILYSEIYHLCSKTLVTVLQIFRITTYSVSTEKNAAPPKRFQAPAERRFWWTHAQI